jgi:hypothetical protein
VWRLGTQPLCGDTALEVWMVLTPLGHNAFGGLACTIMFVRALWLHDRFRQHRKHCTHVGMDQRRPSPLMSRGARTVAVNRVQTGRPVQRRGGKLPRAIEGQSIVPLQARHGCKRLAALALSQAALTHGP